MTLVGLAVANPPQPASCSSAITRAIASASTIRDRGGLIRVMRLILSGRDASPDCLIPLVARQHRGLLTGHPRRASVIRCHAEEVTTWQFPRGSAEAARRG